MSAIDMKYDIASDVKTCKHCGETKELTAFAKVPKAKDGRGWRCYACAYAAKAALNNDDKRAKAAARTRKWKRMNPDKVRLWRGSKNPIDRAYHVRPKRDAKIDADAGSALAQKNAICNMDMAIRRDIRRYLSANKSYVYLITVDHVIRYIGKGTGKRMWTHIGTAIRRNDRINRGWDVRPNTLYSNLYDTIKSQGDLRMNIVRDGLSDYDAYCLESRLIDAIRPMGILWNTANGRA
jgi:hypothetical protein